MIESLPILSIQNIRPVEVLYLMDAPLLFLADTDAGRLLFLWVDEQDGQRLFLAARCPEQDLAALRLGELPLRDAFLSAAANTPSCCWLIRADAEFSVKEVKPQKSPDLPEALLPEVGVRLLP